VRGKFVWSRVFRPQGLLSGWFAMFSGSVASDRMNKAIKFSG
jgi:hypothetical protein